MLYISKLSGTFETCYSWHEGVSTNLTNHQILTHSLSGFVIHFWVYVFIHDTFTQHVWSSPIVVCVSIHNGTVTVYQFLNKLKFLFHLENSFTLRTKNGKTKQLLKGVKKYHTYCAHCAHQWNKNRKDTCSVWDAFFVNVLFGTCTLETCLTKNCVVTNLCLKLSTSLEYKLFERFEFATPFCWHVNSHHKWPACQWQLSCSWSNLRRNFEKRHKWSFQVPTTKQKINTFFCFWKNYHMS